MTNKKIETAIENGLKYIKKATDQDVFLGFETPFVSILVWQALEKINNPTAKQIIKNGIEKIIDEKNENWSFNYWKRESKKYIAEPYPDDLDDTFCALRTIFQHNPNLIKSKDWVKITNLLVFCEEKTGGPYRTWVLPKENEKWRETDLAVNCNIQYFLETQEIELKKINNLIEKSISEKSFYSPYYDENQVIYFIGRVYKGKNKDVLNELINKKIIGEKNPLELAILLSSAMRLGSEIEENYIEKLTDQQTNDGSWSKENFYHCKKNEYIGDKALSTALIIETLNLYKLKKQTKVSEPETNITVNKIVREIKKCSVDLDKKTKKKFDQICQKITKKENVEMILMSPFVVAENLTETKKITEDFLIKLSVITALGWMAYTIYDDLIDGDKSINWLPIANIICRKMDIMFVQLLPEKENFLKEYQETMKNLEEANFWELDNCRGRKGKIPNFNKIERLADRSMGHALTAMAVLYKEEVCVKDILKLKTFFQFFLAAKQMSDDAHDWETDLKKGQINSAAVEVLKISTDKNYDKLRLIFWEKVFDKYAERIMNYCEKAKATIKQVSCLKSTACFDKMVEKVIKSTKMALDEKKETIDFVNNYYKK